MRKRAASLLFLLTLTACTATPARQALVAHELATGIVDSLNTAREARLLNDADLRRLAPFVASLSLAQQSATLAARSHSPDLDAQLLTLHEATLALLRARETAIQTHTHKE